MRSGQDKRADIKCLLEHANSYKEVVQGKRLGDLQRHAGEGATAIQASHQVASNVWEQFDEVFKNVHVLPEVVAQFERGAKTGGAKTRVPPCAA